MIIKSSDIIRKTSTNHTTNCGFRSIEYIVIHYTANTSSPSGKAADIATWFASAESSASADFIVDDKNIVQYNPEPQSRYCWSVGGNKYDKMQTKLGGRLYGVARNRNSISIELVSSKVSKKTLNSTDSDWYFTDAVKERAIALTKYLMDLYHIDKSHVIMHHEVTGKVCPAPFCYCEAALSEWEKFKNAIVPINEQKISFPEFKLNDTHVNIKDSFIRSNPGAKEEYKVKYLNLSATLKKKSIMDSDGSAKFKAGCTFTLVESKEVEGNLWGKMKSGYWLPLVYKGSKRVE